MSLPLLVLSCSLASLTDMLFCLRRTALDLFVCLDIICLGRAVVGLPGLHHCRGVELGLRILSSSAPVLVPCASTTIVNAGLLWFFLQPVVASVLCLSDGVRTQ